MGKVRRERLGLPVRTARTKSPKPTDKKNNGQKKPFPNESGKVIFVN